MSLRVVAIDGPSGSGKSTTARGVADALGLGVLDTGAMYRAVTLAVLEAGVATDDADGVRAVAEAADLSVERGLTRLDGRDVSAAIRSGEVTAAVSAVSAHPGVRANLVARQRAWVDAHGGGVVEGRDIGTVVFPDAPVKVYLVADEHERARRRHREQASAADVGAVRDSLVRRDDADASRAVSPLRAAGDSIVIDTTELGIDAVVARIVDRYRAVVV